MASRSSSRSSSGAPNLAPVFIAMGVLVGGALLVAVMGNKDKENKANAAASEPADAPQTSKPFGDRDNDPKARGGGKLGMKNTAPAGLEETALWVGAKANAEKGMALVKEALAARKKGDEEAYQKKGREGQDLLDEALHATGDWIIDLSLEHPEDRQVARLKRHRSKWGDLYKKVRFVD